MTVKELKESLNSIPPEMENSKVVFGNVFSNMTLKHCYKEGNKVKLSI